MTNSKKKQTKVKRKTKPINWREMLKKSKKLEEKQDAARAVELIKELYFIVITKHK